MTPNVTAVPVWSTIHKSMLLPSHGVGKMTCKAPYTGPCTQRTRADAGSLSSPSTDIAQTQRCSRATGCLTVNLRRILCWRPLLAEEARKQTLGCSKSGTRTRLLFGIVLVLLRAAYPVHCSLRGGRRVNLPCRVHGCSDRGFCVQEAFPPVQTEAGISLRMAGEVNAQTRFTVRDCASGAQSNLMHCPGRIEPWSLRISKLKWGDEDHTRGSVGQHLTPTPGREP